MPRRRTGPAKAAAAGLARVGRRATALRGLNAKRVGETPWLPCLPEATGMVVANPRSRFRSSMTAPVGVDEADLNALFIGRKCKAMGIGEWGMSHGRVMAFRWSCLNRSAREQPESQQQ